MWTGRQGTTTTTTTSTAASHSSPYKLKSNLLFIQVRKQMLIFSFFFVCQINRRFFIFFIWKYISYMNQQKQ